MNRPETSLFVGLLMFMQTAALMASMELDCKSLATNETKLLQQFGIIHVVHMPYLRVTMHFGLLVNGRTYVGICIRYLKLCCLLYRPATRSDIFK